MRLRFVPGMTDSVSVANYVSCCRLISFWNVQEPDQLMLMTQQMLM